MEKRFTLYSLIFFFLKIKCILSNYLVNTKTTITSGSLPSARYNLNLAASRLGIYLAVVIHHSYPPPLALGDNCQLLFITVLLERTLVQQFNSFSNGYQNRLQAKNIQNSSLRKLNCPVHRFQVFARLGMPSGHHLQLQGVPNNINKQNFGLNYKMTQSR